MIYDPSSGFYLSVYIFRWVYIPYCFWRGLVGLENMRERGADAMLVLRNENKWAMTGNYFDIFSIFFLFDIFCLILIL